MAAAAALASPPAQACSSTAACTRTTLYPIGATVPANVPAFEWWLSTALPNAAPGIQLEVQAGGAWSALPIDVTADAFSFAYTIRPRQALTAGASYRLTMPPSCVPPDPTGTPSTREFVAGDAAPFPTRLGTLTATPPESAIIQQPEFVPGICAYHARGTISVVTVQLAPEAQLWEPMLIYQAQVDGQPYGGLVEAFNPDVQPPPGYTNHGRGTVRLGVLCGPANGEPFTAQRDLAEGAHDVVFRARVAGTDTWLATDPLRVELRCDAPRRDGSTGCAVPRAGTRRERGAAERSAALAVLVALAALGQRRRFRG